MFCLGKRDMRLRTGRGVALACALMLVVAGCGGQDAETGRTDVDADTNAELQDQGTIDTTVDAGGDDAATDSNAQECDGLPTIEFSLANAVTGEAETQLGSYQNDGQDARLGFAENADFVANLDLFFPGDFTVGQSVEATELTGEINNVEYELVSGMVTVISMGEEIGHETVCGTFDVSTQGEDGSEVTLTGTFNNVPNM